MSRPRASARERLLAAIDGAEGAPVPCSFMIFRALSEQCRDEYEFAARQDGMGLDAVVRLHDLPIRFAPEVEVRDWVEPAVEGQEPRLHRTYQTPAGALTASVKLTSDWPYGARLPLFGDYITPRAAKCLVTGPEDLEPLRYLFVPSSAADIGAFRRDAVQRSQFARERGFLLTAGWRSGRDLPDEDKGLIGDDFSTSTVIDALMWLCGATQPLLWAYDEPAFLGELISLLADWNRRRLEVHLETGADLVIRRAWYEGTEFWSPRFYREFILPGLRREVDLVHQAGARYGYVLTSGMVALADPILEAGVDVIIGVDPGEGKGTTLAQVRESFGGRIGLWGGVSGPLAVEQGTEDQVRQAVAEAISVLGATGRFILSPVDNIRTSDEPTWRNVDVFIKTWKALTAVA